MVARLTLTIRSPGLLIGVRGIEILLDGEMVDRVQFGEACTIECEAGEHTLRARMRAVISRRSNILKLTVADGEDRRFDGKYSRLWGTLPIRELRA
ncbi:hypothetical protein [Bauldia litoralis]|uniref:hypothetical protein n=1 Tax=Bauldia litoralis TaxID=665467 RepID=UPI00326662AD